MVPMKHHIVKPLWAERSFRRRKIGPSRNKPSPVQHSSYQLINSNSLIKWSKGFALVQAHPGHSMFCDEKVQQMTASQQHEVDVSA